MRLFVIPCDVVPEHSTGSYPAHARTHPFLLPYPWPGGAILSQYQQALYGSLL